MREVAEETGVHLAAPGTVVGYQQLTVHSAPPAGYRYPHPDTYIGMWVTHLEQHPTLGGSVPAEIGEVTFLDPVDAVARFTALDRSWVPLLKHVLGHR